MQNTYRDAFVDCCNLILQFYRSMRIDRGENHGLGAYAGVHHRNRRPRIVLRNEYLVTENRILEARIKGRLLFSDVVLRCTPPDTVHRKFPGNEAPNGCSVPSAPL